MKRTLAVRAVMVAKQDSRERGAEAVIEHTYDSATPATLAVIQAIAAIEDVDPTELGITLYDYVPPDALDMIVGHDTAPGTVELVVTIEAYEVRISDTGTVRVFEPDR